MSVLLFVVSRLVRAYTFSLPCVSVMFRLRIVSWSMWFSGVKGASFIFFIDSCSGA